MHLSYLLPIMAREANLAFKLVTQFASQECRRKTCEECDEILHLVCEHVSALLLSTVTALSLQFSDLNHVFEQPMHVMSSSLDEHRWKPTNHTIVFPSSRRGHLR